MTTALKIYLIWLSLCGLALVGWVINLVKLVHLFVAHAPVDTMFIGRILGVPVPVIGAILGWF